MIHIGLVHHAQCGAPCVRRVVHGVVRRVVRGVVRRVVHGVVCRVVQWPSSCLHGCCYKSIGNNVA